MAALFETAMFRTGRTSKAGAKAAYGVNRTVDRLTGEANEYAYVSGSRGIMDYTPALAERDDYTVQLLASTRMVKNLEAIVALMPTVRSGESGPPYLTVVLSYTKEVDAEQVARDWATWEDEQGLAASPYVEWCHKKGQHRPPHFHRLYGRVTMAVPRRMVRVAWDYKANEVASVLVGYELRDQGFGPMLGKWPHHVLDRLEQNPERVAERDWYVGHLRGAIERHNDGLTAVGKPALTIPTDARGIATLYKTAAFQSARSEGNERRADRPDGGGATADIARKIIPLLQASSSREETVAALNGSGWSLYRGKKAAVLVHDRDPTTGTTGARIGLPSLYRAYIAQTSPGVPRDARAEIAWVKTRIGDLATLPAVPSRMDDPHRAAYRAEANAADAARKKRKKAKAALARLQATANSETERAALEAEIADLTRRISEHTHAFNATKDTTVAAVRNPGAASATPPARPIPDGRHWEITPAGLRPTIKFDRNVPRDTSWQAVGDELRQHLATNPTYTDGIRIAGGPGGTARADLIAVALVRSGYPAERIQNAVDAPELMRALRALEPWPTETPSAPPPLPVRSTASADLTLAFHVGHLAADRAGEVRPEPAARAIRHAWAKMALDDAAGIPAPVHDVLQRLALPTEASKLSRRLEPDLVRAWAALVQTDAANEPLATAAVQAVLTDEAVAPPAQVANFTALIRAPGALPVRLVSLMASPAAVAAHLARIQARRAEDAAAIPTASPDPTPSPVPPAPAANPVVEPLPVKPPVASPIAPSPVAASSAPVTKPAPAPVVESPPHPLASVVDEVRTAAEKVVSAAAGLDAAAPTIRRHVERRATNQRVPVQAIAAQDDPLKTAIRDLLVAPSLDTLREVIEAFVERARRAAERARSAGGFDQSMREALAKTRDDTARAVAWVAPIQDGDPTPARSVAHALRPEQLPGSRATIAQATSAVDERTPYERDRDTAHQTRAAYAKPSKGRAL